MVGVNKNVIVSLEQLNVSRKLIVSTLVSCLNKLNVMSFVLNFPLPILNHFTDWNSNDLGLTLAIDIGDNKLFLYRVVVNVLEELYAIKLNVLGWLSRSLEDKHVLV